MKRSVLLASSIIMVLLASPVTSDALPIQYSVHGATYGSIVAGISGDMEIDSQPYMQSTGILYHISRFTLGFSDGSDFSGTAGDLWIQTDQSFLPLDVIDTGWNLYGTGTWTDWSGSGMAMEFYDRNMTQMLFSSSSYLNLAPVIRLHGLEAVNQSVNQSYPNFDIDLWLVRNDVPEPSAMLLLGVGCLGVVILYRYRCRMA